MDSGLGATVEKLIRGLDYDSYEILRSEVQLCTLENSNVFSYILANEEVMLEKSLVRIASMVSSIVYRIEYKKKLQREILSLQKEKNNIMVMLSDDDELKNKIYGIAVSEDMPYDNKLSNIKDLVKPI